MRSQMAHKRGSFSDIVEIKLITNSSITESRITDSFGNQMLIADKSRADPEGVTGGPYPALSNPWKITSG